MGHERIGALPKTRQWRDIVERIDGFANRDEDVAAIAANTIKNVRGKYRQLIYDEGVNAVFQYLVGLSVASNKESPSEFLESNGIPLPDDPTPLALSISLRRWVQKKHQGEHTELALQAATDSIAQWKQRYQGVQENLFRSEPHPYEVWRKASKGNGFSELAHFFFSNFTRRYLNYFLEREASAELDTISSRDQFEEDLAQHAAERAKITQSFAAGWFNKNALENMPSEEEIAGFLAHAFGKLRDELTREEG